MSVSVIKIKMNAKTHDEARVISAQFKRRLSDETEMCKLISALTGSLQAIVKWVDDHNAIIGHVKGYVTWDEETIMLSTTGGEVQVKGSEKLPKHSCTAYIGVAAIVFGIGLKDIADRVSKSMKTITTEFGSVAAVACDFEHHHDHKHEEEHKHECSCQHEHTHHKHHDHEGCTCVKHSLLTRIMPEAECNHGDRIHSHH